MAKKQKIKFEEAAELVKGYFEEYSLGHATIVSNLNKYQRMWEGKPVDRRYTGGLANMVVNETHKAVETFVANLVNLRSAVKPSYEVEERAKVEGLPTNPSRLREIQLLLDFQLAKAQIDDKYEYSYRTLSTEGTIFFKCFWDMTSVKYTSYDVKDETIDEYQPGDMQYGVPKEGAVPDKKVVGQNLTPVDVEEKFDSANYVLKDGRYIYINEKIEDFDKQPCVIELEKDVSWTDLLLNDDYENMDILEEKIFSKKSEKEKKKGVKVDLLHYWGKYDKAQDGIAEEYEIIVEKSTWTVLLCRTNPYYHGTRPYRCVKFLPKKGSARGMGICELMYRQQVELNDNRNQMSDNKTLQNACMFVAQTLTTIKKDQLKIRPFGIIEAGVNGKLEPLRVANFIDSALLLENTMKNDFQTTTGATMPLQGSGAGADTLGQSELMLKQGLNKLGTLLSRVERDLIQETYRLFYQLTLQYMDRKWKLIITGSDVPLEVDKVKIFADVDFRPAGSKYIQQSLLQKQQDLQLLTLISSLPRYVGVMDTLIKEVFKASGRGDLIEKELQKIQQQPAPSAEVPPEQNPNGQLAAGNTPQVNSTTDMAGLMRSAGTPMRNQQGGGSNLG